jgi:hypothetical protein
MSELPTAEDFSQHVGTKFGVRVEAPRPLELELTSVKTYDPLPADERRLERFSLYFLGPPDMMLQQGTYPLVHPSIGEHLLFIVPIGRDDEGFRYEVVFNYFRK